MAPTVPYIVRDKYTDVGVRWVVFDAGSIVTITEHEEQKSGEKKPRHDTYSYSKYKFPTPVGVFKTLNDCDPLSKERLCTFRTLA